MKVLNKKEKLISRHGGMLITVLIFTTIFVAVGLVLVGMVNYQFKYTARKVAWNKSVQIAEAGMNYYRWHLAHSPTDYWDGNPQGTAGPFVHDYDDPVEGRVGQFALTITAPTECSNTVDIEVEAWIDKYPNIQRKVKARYGRESLAQFSFIANSSFWLKDIEELHGPIHSNGGIRHEGTVDSLITSARDTYWCTYQDGCSMSGETKAGIWGDGEDQTLRQYPVSNIDFDSITADLASLRQSAQNSGIYIAQQGLGYHIVFQSNGSFNLYRVTRKQNNVWAWDGDNWKRRSDDIRQQSYVGNYTLPSACAIIFVEDDVWVDGVINGTVTLVAARLPEAPGNSPNIVVNDDIVYLAKDGSHSLGLIAQQDIIIPLYGYPKNSATIEDLEIDAVLLAQNGHVMRMHYDSPWPYYLNDTLTVYGAVISNTMRKWSWQSCDGCPIISGYQNTDITYDPNLTYNPPPGFPTTGDYRFLQWEEVTEK